MNRNRGSKPKSAKQFVRIDSKSTIMEAYRIARTNIEFSDSGNNKVILLTSALQDEGKSTTVSNLARAFAQSGYRTLLIDLDLRKPVLHKIFDRSGTIGVTSIITNKAKISEAIQTTDDANLYLLASGIRPMNPAEFLRSPSMENLLRFLRKKFDVILLDSPPAMAIADAAIISTYADSTILVTAAGRIDYRCIQQAITNLKNVNANIIGCIINNMKAKDSSYKYKNYYYYSNYKYK